MNITSTPAILNKSSLTKKSSWFVQLATVLVGVLLTVNIAQSQPLQSVVEELLNRSPRINAALADRQSAEAKLQEVRRRGWTPAVDLSYDLGKQHYETNTSGPTDTLKADRTVIRVTQSLFDFGRTEAQIREVQKVLDQTSVVAASTSEAVLLEALTAQWSVVRAEHVVKYSRESEASVRNQAELENSLVELGKGYESNVLQAKVQLAGAEARRIRAEGALEIARARVAAVFGDLVAQVGYSEVAIPREAALPKSMEEAIQSSLEGNKQIQIGVHRSQALRHRISSIEAREYRPKIQLLAERSWRNNVDATLDGTKVDDAKLMVQFQYSFNAGLAGKSASNAANGEFLASVSREMDTRNLVTEQVRIAWRNLQVAKSNRDILGNQVRIAAKFLEMAVAERKLGRRTLLDVLSAEVSLINAMSDFISTEADAAIAGITLLQAMGKLEIDAIQIKPIGQVIPQIGLAEANMQRPLANN